MRKVSKSWHYLARKTVSLEEGLEVMTSKGRKAAHRGDALHEIFVAAAMVAQGPAVPLPSCANIHFSN